MAEPGDASGDVQDQTREGENTVQNQEPSQVREANEESERSMMQVIYDGITDAKDKVSAANSTEVEKDARVAEDLADAGEAKRQVQKDMNNEFSELSADATRSKANVETGAVEKDDELRDLDKRSEAKSNYDNSLDGGEVSGEERFGVFENLINTNFLADDVVKMRNVEDNSYTHGDQEGSSIPFIEKADQLDENARKWAKRFSDDFQLSLNNLGVFVNSFNLDETKEAYENAVEIYEKTDEFEERIEEIVDEVENEVSEINEEISGDYEGSLDEEGQQIIRDAERVLDGQLNDVDNPRGEVDFNPPERENAEQDVRQLRARSLDAAALFDQRLDEARDEIGEVKEEIQGVREEIMGTDGEADGEDGIEGYKEQVEDLTRVEGIGPGFASLFDDMGFDTIMDVAAADSDTFSSDPAYQKHKRQNEGVAIPDAGDLRDAAYEALNEIASDMDYLDLIPTETIRDAGSDYSDDDQRRRMHEAMYESADSIVFVMHELERVLPDLDQYDMDWDGEEETLEDERKQVYDNLGIEYPSDPRTALEQPEEYEA